MAESWLALWIPFTLFAHAFAALWLVRSALLSRPGLLGELCRCWWCSHKPSEPEEWAGEERAAGGKGGGRGCMAVPLACATSVHIPHSCMHAPTNALRLPAHSRPDAHTWFPSLLQTCAGDLPAEEQPDGAPHAEPHGVHQPMAHVSDSPVARGHNRPPPPLHPYPLPSHHAFSFWPIYKDNHHHVCRGRNTGRSSPSSCWAKSLGSTGPW